MPFKERCFKRIGITSFKGRLRFWFICLATLIVLLISIPFVFLGREQQRNIAMINIDKMINIQQVAIDSWLEEKLSDIKAISQLPAIKENNLLEMKETMETFDNNHLEFNGIVYVNKNGISEVDTSGEAGLNLSDRTYYRKGKEGKTLITDILIGRQSHQPIIIISAPVYDYDQQFKGLIFGSIPTTTINMIMGELRDGDRETYLVNQDGMLITESLQGEVGEYIDSEIFMQAMAGNRINHFYENYNGERVLGDYRWVHNNRWIIIGETKESIIYDPFYRMATIFSSIFILLVIIGSVLIIRISNRVEAPIRNVLEGTRKIGEGNWKYRLKLIDNEEVKEFQELRGNFNHMAELIERHIHLIAESEERFRMITEYSSDMITIHDLSGNCLYVSPAVKEILQYGFQELIGYNCYSFIHRDDAEIVRKSHEKLLKAGYAVVAYRIRRKDGKYIWLESSIKHLHEKNSEKEQVIVISRNITERKLAEKKLQEANRLLLELSIKDGLTGAWNRRAFDECLTKEWNRAVRNGTSLSLIMIDLDYFKPHIMIDTVIKRGMIV